MTPKDEWVYTHLEEGMMTRQTGADGHRTQAYDALGRVITQIGFSSAGTALVTIIDTYDAAGRKSQQNRDGAVTSPGVEEPTVSGMGDTHSTLWPGYSTCRRRFP